MGKMKELWMANIEEAIEEAQLGADRGYAEILRTLDRLVQTETLAVYNLLTQSLRERGIELEVDEVQEMTSEIMEECCNFRKVLG